MKPGGSARRIEVAGGRVAHGERIDALEMRGAVEELAVTGGFGPAKGGFEATKAERPQLSRPINRCGFSITHLAPARWPCTFVLEWIGKPYGLVKVEYGDLKYKKINPAGAVPALEYGGERSLTLTAIERTGRDGPAA